MNVSFIFRLFQLNNNDAPKQKFTLYRFEKV